MPRYLGEVRRLDDICQEDKTLSEAVLEKIMEMQEIIAAFFEDTITLKSIKCKPTTNR
jgi:hypothetical protein